jgi:hypothetical protein
VIKTSDNCVFSKADLRAIRFIKSGHPGVPVLIDYLPPNSWGPLTPTLLASEYLNSKEVSTMYFLICWGLFISKIALLQYVKGSLLKTPQESNMYHTI